MRGHRGRRSRAYLELAEEAAPRLAGADQRRWLDRLEREHDNLRATLMWAANRPDPELAVRVAFALWRFWQQRGYAERGADPPRRPARPRLGSVARASARLAEAGCRLLAGGPGHRGSLLRGGARAGRQIGDRREIANALFNRAYADAAWIMGGRTDGDASAAREMLQEALEIYFRDLGDAAGEGNILWAIGSFHFFANDMPSGDDLPRGAAA